MRRHLSSLALCALFVLVPGHAPVYGQNPPSPWLEPQDTFQALFERDRYAWRLFVALNWPANVAAKEADNAKAFGAPGPVVWEAWRNVRPGAGDTVYPRDGSDPGPWLGKPAEIARAINDLEPQSRTQAALASRRARPSGGAAPLFDAPVGQFSEVRMNRHGFEFVRQNKLYDLKGQIAVFKSGVGLSFPPAAKEVKAQWRQISEADKGRYHWAEVTDNSGNKQPWGLTALHIVTKDLPNWFWATFEHIDNRTPGVVGGGAENEGWQLPSVDLFACPAPPHDCNAVPKNIGLEGTKWTSYRLRGTQIDFIDSNGANTILANSQIEAGLQTTSSCMTCHAQAAKNKEGVLLGFQRELGPPRPEWFQDPVTKKQIYIQQDFVFSLDRASPSSP